MSSNIAPGIQPASSYPAPSASPMGAPSVDPSQSSFGPVPGAAPPAPYNGPSADAFQSAGNPAGGTAGSTGDDAALQQLLAALGGAQQGQAPAPGSPTAALEGMPAAPQGQDPTQQLLAQLGGQGQGAPTPAGQDPTQQLLAQLGAMQGDPNAAAAGMPGAPMSSVHQQTGPNGENWVLSNSTGTDKSSDSIFSKALDAVKTPVGMGVSAALVLGSVVGGYFMMKKPNTDAAKDAVNKAIHGFSKTFRDNHEETIGKIEKALGKKDELDPLIATREEDLKKVVAEHENKVTGTEDAQKIKDLNQAYTDLLNHAKGLGEGASSLDATLKDNATKALETYWNDIASQKK